MPVEPFSRLGAVAPFGRSRKLPLVPALRRPPVGFGRDHKGSTPEFRAHRIFSDAITSVELSPLSRKPSATPMLKVIGRRSATVKLKSNCAPTVVW